MPTSFHGIRDGPLQPGSRFRHRANKMMTSPLEREDFFEERRIKPHSLKVTAISSLMRGVAKGAVNLAQLSARGNYRSVAAREMGESYWRNSAQKQLFVSKYAQKRQKGSKRGIFLPTDLPDFRELSQRVVIF